MENKGRFIKGQKPWNYKLLGDKYSSHYKDNKIKGGRKKGFLVTKETRRKLSDSLKGNKNQLGYKKSEETKQKISLTRNFHEYGYGDHGW